MLAFVLGRSSGAGDGAYQSNRNVLFARKQFGEGIRIDERLGAQYPDGCGHA